MDYESKLQAFADKLEADRLADLIRTGVDCEGNRLQAKVSVKPGKKYAKVDVGHSGAYMVVNDTGEIFGVKAYGVIHKGHQYGTLDTIDNWYWGTYYAVPVLIFKKRCGIA